MKTPNVKQKKSLKVILSVNDIIKNVKTEFEGIDFKTLKFNPDFLLYICEQIENLVKNKYKKIDKKQLVVDILTKLLNNNDPKLLNMNGVNILNDIDIKHIESIIEHLHSCKLIKKISFLKKFFLNLIK